MMARLDPRTGAPIGNFPMQAPTLLGDYPDVLEKADTSYGAPIGIS